MANRRSRTFKLSKSDEYFSIVIEGGKNGLEYWGSFKIEQLKELLKDEIDFVRLDRAD